MTTYDNGWPETPEWRCEPKPSPFEDNAGSPRATTGDLELHLIRGEN